MNADPHTRPRCGLIINTLKPEGGMGLAVRRHIRLLADDVDIIPIALELSGNERDWCGRVEQLTLDGVRAYRIHAADLRVDRVSGNMDMRQRTFVDELVRIVRREELALLHVFGAFELRPFVGALAAVEADIPLIVTFRGSDLDIRLFGSNFGHVQTAVRCADACVCLNARARRVVARVLQPQAPVYEIPNHIEAESPDDAPPAPVQLSHDSAPVIGCVGEFRRVIGLDWLLAAFARVAAEMPCRLALIGPFRDTEALYYTPLIDRHPFVQRILRVGPVAHAQIPAYLNACDLLVFPSVSDGSPNKVLEAMRAARPIIAAPVGGILEMIRHEQEGLLVDPRATDDLAAAITRLLRDPAEARALGRAARERALTHFTAARELAAWRACYGTVLGKGEPGNGAADTA